MEKGQGSEQEMNSQDARQNNVLGKRIATDTQQVVHGGSNMLAIIPSMPTTSKVAAMVDQIEGEVLPGITPAASSTPQKNANRKKYKGLDGEAVDSSEGQQTLGISASSPGGDGRRQREF